MLTQGDIRWIAQGICDDLLKIGNAIAVETVRGDDGLNDCDFYIDVSTSPGDPVAHARIPSDFCAGTEARLVGLGESLAGLRLRFRVDDDLEPKGQR